MNTLNKLNKGEYPQGIFLVTSQGLLLYKPAPFTVKCLESIAFCQKNQLYQVHAVWIGGLDTLIYFIGRLPYRYDYFECLEA
jgi:hypothetical protein